MYCSSVFYFTLLLCVSVFGQNTYSGSSESCQTPQRKIGQCISLKRCPLLLDLLREKPVSEKSTNYLRQSHCGFEGSQPKVCCALEGNDNEMTDPLSSDLLPSTEVCGFSKEERIVGGETAGLNEFPWMALLEYDKPSGKGFHCGGSLINNRYIITAAHCLRKIPRSWTLISVRLGEYDLDQDEDCDGDTPGLEYCSPKPLDIEVEEKIVHQDYNANSAEQLNDIALLRLKEEVKFHEFVKPICLPKSSNLRNNRFSGAKMTVAGWGRTENSSQSPVKQKLEIPVKSDDHCVSVYSKGANLRLSENQLCAGGEKGKDSCTGDSGGPLMVLNKSPTEENWYCMGLVSFGPTPCGLKDWPGVYTRVGPYMPWIISKLKP